MNITREQLEAKLRQLEENLRQLEANIHATQGAMQVIVSLLAEDDSAEGGVAAETGDTPC